MKLSRSMGASNKSKYRKMNYRETQAEALCKLQSANFLLQRSDEQYLEYSVRMMYMKNVI